MILADTSIWIDYLFAGDELVSQLLAKRAVLIHPFVIGEIAMGNLRNRKRMLTDLSDLPSLPISPDGDVLRLIELHNLGGSGIGYIDAHLLTSVRPRPATTIWTRDRRMLAAAERTGIAARLTH